MTEFAAYIYRSVVVEDDEDFILAVPKWSLNESNEGEEHVSSRSTETSYLLCRLVSEQRGEILVLVLIESVHTSDEFLISQMHHD